MGKHIPLRMCAACRQMRPKEELIRLTEDGGEILIDNTKKMGGRGVYICCCIDCVRLAKKKKALQRMFKRAVPDEVYQMLEEKIDG